MTVKTASVAIAAALLWISVPAYALVITESDDFTGSLNEAVSIGEFSLGTTTVTGSLSGQCVPRSSGGRLSCNLRNNGVLVTGDSLDIFAFELADGLELAGINASLFNSTGQASFYTVNSRSVTSFDDIGLLQSIERNTSSAADAALFPYTSLNRTIFWISASGPLGEGAFATDYSISFDVQEIGSTVVPLPAAAPIFLSGLAAFSLIKRKRKTQRVA